MMNYILQRRNTLRELSREDLVEEILKNEEGGHSSMGALVCITGKFTGRSPLDKFIVCDDSTEFTVDWGAINIPISKERFEGLYDRMISFLLQTERKIYVRDVFACAMPEYRLPIRVVNTLAWHNLFCANLFMGVTLVEFGGDIDRLFEGFLMIVIPEFEADPMVDGTRQGNFTIINFKEKIILIGGTAYAGEMKKAVFSVLNYLLPIKSNVLPMHCSATVGKGGDSAIFFGLSGTGKTTLSADPERLLVGDDEHGWAQDKIFNFEGGCYAKMINLSRENEPNIYDAIRYGTVLENVVMDSNKRSIDFSDDSITENTRAAYPLSYVSNALDVSIANNPKNIFFLTCDAYGVLPLISKLTAEQAMYYFLSGYTAKVAGTESGIREPSPTFSACFGAVFLPLHPTVYADLFGEKLKAQHISTWLVNTGWVGGRYGVGRRIDIPTTRAIVSAILGKKLDKVECVKHDIFGLYMPISCPGISSEILNPKTTWGDMGEYEEEARGLANAFRKNFSKYEGKVSSSVLNAGPG